MKFYNAAAHLSFLVLAVGSIGSTSAAMNSTNTRLCKTNSDASEEVYAVDAKTNLERMKQQCNTPIVYAGEHGYDKDCKGGEKLEICLGKDGSGQNNEFEKKAFTYIPRTKLMANVNAFAVGSYEHDENCKPKDENMWKDDAGPDGVTKCIDPVGGAAIRRLNEDPSMRERDHYFCKYVIPKDRLQLFYNLKDPKTGYGFMSAAVGGWTQFDGWAVTQHDCSVIFSNNTVKTAYKKSECPDIGLDKILGPVHWKCSGTIDGKKFCSNPNTNRGVYLGGDSEEVNGYVDENCCVNMYGAVATKKCPKLDNNICNGDDKSPEPSPTSNGDPHFKTWTGFKFDFHGGCDLVLIENPHFANGLGLFMHVRTKIVSWWSHIESAAIKLGDYILEITGGMNQISYWLNAAKVEDMETGDAALGDYPVHFRRVNDHQSITRIQLGNENAISIETYKLMVRVNVGAPSADKYAGSYGMLGSYPEGKMHARDKVTIVEDPNEFGQEWHVLPSDPELFHTKSDVQHPMKCPMPVDSKKSASRRLGESLITKEEAAKACAHVDDDERNACIFDVVAANDLDMAESY